MNVRGASRLYFLELANRSIHFLAARFLKNVTAHFVEGNVSNTEYFEFSFYFSIRRERNVFQFVTLLQSLWVTH